MNKFKYLLLPIIVAVFIFFIPFSWLKPGEMDLGGDNSRLYFYDPIAYLISQSLYSVSHSGFGQENLSYYGIPFFLLLAFVKSLVQSPTILISIFHGFNLSIGFVSCYLVVREFLKREERTTKQNQLIIEASSILAGLYYTLSPNPIGWWGYQLLPMNLVFLNPLLFFLLLRFFLTGSMKYLLVSLLVTFLFSPNFSLIGAPTFFSFFPLAVLFLFIYAKFIKKRPIPIVKIAVGLLLFVLIQAFHLIPQIASILTPGSFANEFIFGAQGKLQWGLKYFVATAPSIKVSYAMLGLLQYTEPKFYWWIFILFPFLFVFGLLWNKSRLYLLSVIFFLVTLFFVSANITTIGLKFYMLLFNIPGFSMFRVFFGQWQWAYLFFYTLLVGQALATVMGKAKIIQRILLLGFLVLLLVITAWSFIIGELTDTKLWQSKDIRAHVKMDPAYEKMLSYIRTLPVDGKILSLPLNDHGYQVLKGENDAAYVGPSTITYLAARNEFTSNAELAAFGPSLLTAAREGNYPMFRDILSVLNIKYIFYNEDPYIYVNNFPTFPYIEVLKFFPDTQDGYKKFIKNLGAKEIKTIAGKYHIYALEDPSYIPHIYAADKLVYWNDAIEANVHIPLSFYPEDKRLAFYNINNITIFNMNKHIFEDFFLKAQNKSQIFDFFKTKDLPKFVSPTISQKLSSFIYPLVVLREKMDIGRFPKVTDEYIDRSIYFAEKRINELVKLQEVPIQKNVRSISDLAVTWQEPKLWEFTRYSEYNSWEITLARYYKAMTRLIKQVDTPNQSHYSSVTNKVELKKVLGEHESQLGDALRKDSSKAIREKKYLLSLARDMFDDIVNKLNLNLPDDWIMRYDVGNTLEDGIYQVYVNKDDIRNLNITLSIDGKSISPKTLSEGEWIRFDDVVVRNKASLPVAIKMNYIPNLVDETKWKTAEQTKGEIAVQAKIEGAKQKDQGEVTTLAVTYSYLSNTSGLIRDISKWRGDSVYVVSFDYLTYDQNFLFTLYERGGTKKNRYVNDTYSEKLRSKEWGKFSSAFLSLKDAKSAFLQISKDQEDFQDENYAEGIKKIDIRNLSVLRITDPQIADPRIVFKKVIKAEETSIPQIIFTKINPTKYKVTVHGARDPYSLVLSQEFNTKWKLFFPNEVNEAKTLKGFISRTFAKIMKGILSANNIEVSSEGSKKELTSYFHNNITEGMHKNIFLDQNTFETFGYDPILEKRHLPVNGYANSWYISPEDVQGKEDYELIIKMTSQKLFYVSLLVSLGGLLLLILLFIKSFIRIRK